MTRTFGSMNKSNPNHPDNLKVAMFGNKNEPAKNAYVRIRKTFAYLEKAVDQVINGKLNAMVIAGAPGCGKTHAVESKLYAAEAEGKITKFSPQKGTMSAIVLYQNMHVNCEPGNVLFLDDCDNIWDDPQCFDLLKAVLDTSKHSRRMVGWGKETRILENNGVPYSFKFEGRIIVATNKNMVDEIDKGNKRSEHYKAVLDRCDFIDLGIHSKREVLFRMQQVIHETTFLQDEDIPKEMAGEFVEWIGHNIENLLTLSMRTMIKLARYYSEDPDNWRDDAAVKLCRHTENKRGLTTEGALTEKELQGLMNSSNVTSLNKEIQS